jgi:hypothetical protein
MINTFIAAFYPPPSLTVKKDKRDVMEEEGGGRGRERGGMRVRMDFSEKV